MRSWHLKLLLRILNHLLKRKPFKKTVLSLNWPHQTFLETLLLVQLKAPHQSLVLKLEDQMLLETIVLFIRILLIRTAPTIKGRKALSKCHPQMTSLLKLQLLIHLLSSSLLNNSGKAIEKLTSLRSRRHKSS